MTRLVCILCLLSLACSFSAVIPADNTPAANSHFAAEVITSPAIAPQKPANESKSAYPYQTVVTAELLNVREGAGHKYELVPSVWLMKGEQIQVYECVGIWGRIGAGRWINTYYVETRCK